MTPNEHPTRPRRTAPQRSAAETMSPADNNAVRPPRRRPDAEEAPAGEASASARRDAYTQQRSAPTREPARESTVRRPRRPDAASRRTPPRSDLKDNLRSQTPLNRRLQQKTIPTEPGTSRRTSHKQQFRIKQQEKKRPSLWGRYLLLVLLCYAILMPISLLLVSLWLPHHTTPETKNYIYQLGPDTNTYIRKVCSWDTVRRDKTFYVDMTGLAAYCEMSTTGDDAKRRFIVRETGDTVEFIMGQSIAYINGLPERTGGDAYLRDGKVYVPMDFISRCFLGVTVSLDTEKNKITIIRETDEKDNYLTVSFPYRITETIDPIRFTELDVDIQNQIAEQNRPPQPPAPEPSDPDDEVTT